MGQNISKSDNIEYSNCPYKQENDINPNNNMSKPNQQPSPGQPFLLSTERQESSIPKISDKNEIEKWIYPSEQMFWNAMLKKGWRWESDQISQKDMTNIIKIHNKNNEEAWKEICKWEELLGNNPNNLKLKKFSGLAKKYSPRAYFRSLIGHDWIIDRNGKEIRYIIDYYDVGNEEDYKKGNFVHMDIRPAFDSIDSVIVRSKAFILRKLSIVYEKFYAGEN